MKVDIFTLCQFANSEKGGNLNIIGAFQGFQLRQLPVVLPLCALAIRMRFEKVEEGPKKIRISIIDADGKAVMPTLQAEMAVKVGANSSTATVPLVLLIQPLKLPNFGEYSIDLAIDGRQEASTPLYVRQIQNPASPLPPPNP
jgi:hypothetical protein